MHRHPNDEHVLHLSALSYLLPQQHMHLHNVRKPFATLLANMYQAGRQEADNCTIAIVMLSPEKQALPCGMEASVESMTQDEDGSWSVSLRGERIVRFMSALEESDYHKEGAEENGEASTLWFTARVSPLDLRALDVQEVQESGDGDSTMLDIASHEMEPLLECWLDLMKKQSVQYSLIEKPEQFSQYLQRLGPVPPADEYSLRALWIASLLCPGPTSKADLSPELRPTMLGATTALERLIVARMGLIHSITRLRGLDQE